MKIIQDHKLTHENYYNDTDYVSNSMLSHLTNKSPEYFQYMLNHSQPPSSAMKFGSAFHMYVLQPDEFEKHYVVTPNIDKRTKQGKQEYTEFMLKNQFKTLISESDLQTIQMMSDKLSQDSLCKDLLKIGKPEQIIAWNNPEYDVNCKGMLDIHCNINDIIVDLKTTQDCNLKPFTRSIKKYMYHKQAAFYTDAVRALSYYIVAIEKNPPFSLNVFEISGDVLDQGRHLYNQELYLYKRCLDEGNWPGPSMAIWKDVLDREPIDINNFEDIL
jgi:exodeoxyribonuclease VIII